MKFKVPWPLSPESAVQFFTLSLLVFYKNRNKEQPLKNFEQFSKCGFVEFPS